MTTPALATAVNSLYTEPDSGIVARKVFPYLLDCGKKEDTTSDELSPLVNSNYERGCNNEIQTEVLHVIDSSIRNLIIDFGVKCLIPLITVPLKQVAKEDKYGFSFASEIFSAIDNEPVEDGFKHPAEDILQRVLVTEQRTATNWLYEIIINEESNPCITASVIKIVGRLDLEICKEWCFRVVGMALEHGSVAVRDAAAQALESWGSKESIRLLKEHHDSVPWLQDYINNVIIDLEQS